MFTFVQHPKVWVSILKMRHVAPCSVRLSSQSYPNKADRP